MEIINLLVLVIIYYTLYYLEFYQKVLLLFGASMCASFFVDYNFFEENKDDNLIYSMLDYLVYIFTYLYNFIITASRFLFQFNMVSSSYNALQSINTYYVTGRNKIFQKLSKVAFNTFLQIQSSKLNRASVTGVSELNRAPVTGVSELNRAPFTEVSNAPIQNKNVDIYLQNRNAFTSLQNMTPYVSIQNNSPITPQSPENNIEDWKTYVHVKDNINAYTFKDSNEMNSFLDNIIDKKNS